MVLAQCSYHIYTLFLFTRTDIITTIIPLSVLSMGAAPVCSQNSLSHITEAIIWIWLHLLHFNLANQTRDLDEDMRNKPWRPLPSGRITINHAHTLHWVSALVCLGFSQRYSNHALATSITFMILVFSYHKMAFHCHWIMKSVMNSAGLTCLGWGSSLLMGCNRSALDHSAHIALALIAAVIMTTTHAQDFRDVDGDRAIGRKTIPIVLPNVSRYILIAAVIVWSCCLSLVWTLAPPMWAVFLGLATITGYRFFAWRTAKEDRLSFLYYNIWLSVALALPGYYRLRNHWAMGNIDLALLSRAL